MTKTTRNLVVGLAVTVATAGAVRVAAASEAAGTIADPNRRIRTSSTVLAQLIHDATETSATFRGLTETIRRSDGIVYVEEGDCGHGVRACLAAVTAAGPNRILWVKVDTRKSDWDLMGSIGHELRHAVEVLGNPRVTSNAALYLFYAREGRTGTNGAFETDAAVQAGHAVRAEVRRPTVIAQVQ